MSKTFQEVFDEIKSNVTTSKKGRPVKSFSRSDFDRLAKALLNEKGYKLDTISTKDGEQVSKELFPVKELREGMIRSILLSFGVDKAEAQRVAEVDITNVDGLYEFVSELIYQYINAGKKFDFLPKKDFTGSISLKDMGASTGEFIDIRSKEKISVHKEAHKLLEKKSKCPKWLKSKDGKAKKKK